MVMYKNCDFDVISNKNPEEIYKRPCDCMYCKNFYEEFPKKYKQTLELFREFNVVLDRPLTICYMGKEEQGELHRYNAYYSIEENLNMEKVVIRKEGLEIAFRHHDEFNENYSRFDDHCIIEVLGVLIPFENAR